MNCQSFKMFHQYYIQFKNIPKLSNIMHKYLNNKNNSMRSIGSKIIEVNEFQKPARIGVTKADQLIDKRISHKIFTCDSLNPPGNIFGILHLTKIFRDYKTNHFVGLTNSGGFSSFDNTLRCLLSHSSSRLYATDSAVNHQKKQKELNQFEYYNNLNIQTYKPKSDSEMSKLISSYKDLETYFRGGAVSCSQIEKDFRNTQKLFPNPRQTLNNAMQLVSSQLRKRIIEEPRYVEGEDWACVESIHWPSELQFIGYGKTKQSAASAADIKVLHYLLQEGRLNRKGVPCIFDRNERMKIQVGTIPDLTLSEPIIKRMQSLVQTYNQDLLPVLHKIKEEEKERNRRIQEGEEDDIILYEWKRGRKNPSPRSIQRRNDLLRKRLKVMDNNTLFNKRKEFTIYEYREQLLDMLENNQVLIIKGEPGCGKSTQVPQYILERFIENNRGTDCNILITQPRRISAITLSERVANERNESLGDSVGFQIRMNSSLPADTGGTILYCSTGILLKRLQHDSELLDCSHIIIDEAHERDTNIDLLLLLLRRTLENNPKLKLIIMSATINAELFQKYYNNAPALHVPGFTHEVKMHFLEDIEHLKLISTSKQCVSNNPVINEKEIARLINWIHKSKPTNGAILCFLPGWNDILNVQKELNNFKDSSLWILLAHSRLSPAEQRQIFRRASSDQRKVILSTNITETSVTIDDVSYVIDTGSHKEGRILESGCFTMDNQWISQANVHQRKGRAGRVKSGESFHLYTKDVYSRMLKYPIPEISRVPLEKTVLDSKTYSRDHLAAEFLSQLPEPPGIENINQAVDELIELGALDENEVLTPLGRRIALFSLPPKLSKALVHATVFKCLNPMLSIATLLTADTEIFEGGMNAKKETANLKTSFDSTSDHIALAEIYKQWESRGISCRELRVLPEKMEQIKKLRKIHADYLYQCEMLPTHDRFDDSKSECNEYSDKHELIKAVLMSGVDSVCQHRSYKMVGGQLRKADDIVTEIGQNATITSESVNHNRKTFPSPYMCYFKEVHSLERRRTLIRDATMLSPMAVLLFSITGIENVQDDGNSDRKVFSLTGKSVHFKCHEEQLDDILEFRNVLWNIVQYYIERMGKEENTEIMEMMDSYKEALIIFLCKLLNHVKPK